jgi:CDP-diacylglycerol--glycerol-3-phosphate 3-phosphatidyltransferase
VINRSFVSAETRHRVRGLALPVALALGRLGLTPNVLTVIGFLGTCLAALAAAGQHWALAGILVISFGIFDMFDGALARATGRASRFGAFLDSTLDRTGEGLVLAGVAYGCAAVGFLPGVALAVAALAFASVVTYTRAKAEALGLHGEVGFAPRPERLVLLSAGLFLAGVLGGVGSTAVLPMTGGMEPATIASPPFTHIIPSSWLLAGALGLIALLSAITVLQRILHTRRQLDELERTQRSTTTNG